MRVLFSALVAAALWLLATSANALPGVVEYDVDLRADTAALPAWICVLAHAREGRAVNHQTLVPLSALRTVSPDARAYAPVDGEPLKEAHEETKSVSDALRALRAWHVRFDDAKPAGASAICRGDFDLPAAATTPDERMLACVELPGAQQSNTKVAVVEVRFAKTVGRVERVRQLGTMLRIEASDVPADEEAFLKSLGGAYETGDAVRTSGHQAVLPLRPKCADRTVHVPGTSASCAAFEVESKRGDAVAKLVGTTDVHDGSLTLPVAEEDETVTVRVCPISTGASRCQDAPRACRGTEPFVVGRTAGAAERTIEAGVERFRLSWIRPCEVETACPAIAFPLAKGGCDLVPASSCEYQCRLETPASLPLDARLTLPNAAPWMDRVVADGQSLTSFTTDMGIAVELRGWPSVAELRAARDLGDGIDYIDVIGPANDVYRVRVDEQPLPVLHVPHATCNAKLRYRVVGDRRFEEGAVPLKDGKLVILNPMNPMPSNPTPLAAQWDVDLGFGGGFGGDPSPWKPFGALTLAVRKLEPTWYWGVRGTWTFIGQPYDAFDGAGRTQASTVLLNRAFVDVVVFGRVVRFLDLGAGGGPFAGYPYSDADASRVGGLRFGASVSALGRLYVSRVVAVEPTVRLFFDERHSFVVSDPSYADVLRGNPRDDTKRWLQVNVGLMLFVRL